MNNRIKDLFAKKNKDILSVFITAGFPRVDSMVGIVKELAAAGADMVEIGIPFSDPVADGPVIQDSNKVALTNGMNVKLLLEQVAEVRKEVKIPLILMGYVNPVMQFGFEEFCKKAATAGVDGVILPDLPLDEYLSEYQTAVEGNGMLNTFLISPTTSEERIRKIDSVTKGFIYAVSASSTTGAKNDFTKEQIEYFEKLQHLKLKNPLLIGFGISNKETFHTACKYAAGAIVGSAFIKAMGTPDALNGRVREFVNSLRG